MTKNNYSKLRNLLIEFQKEYCPCYKDGNFIGCSGYQNCEFGENGCYGESCSLEDAGSAMYYYYNQKENN
ncbi:MAG: hypothetical protein IJS58_05610 [Bacilli bacterium]|nr:hypothetical protein [Bacilli bacterium]MBQ7276713.1 hypothetical protein [Bacilli bacterium]